MSATQQVLMSSIAAIAPAGDATFNAAAKSAAFTLSGGDLIASSDGTVNYICVTGSSYKSAGKWWATFVFANSVVNSRGVGICKSTDSIADGQFFAAANTYGYVDTGQKRHAGASAAYGATPFIEGDILGVALDIDGGNLYFYKNGAIQNSGTPAYTGLSGNFRLLVDGYNASAGKMNVTMSVSGTPPSGYSNWTN